MGWKYEVAIWKYQNGLGSFDYEIVYAGNNWFMAKYEMWIFRKHPCVRLVRR